MNRVPLFAAIVGVIALLLLAVVFMLWSSGEAAGVSGGNSPGGTSQHSGRASDDDQLTNSAGLERRTLDTAIGTLVDAPLPPGVRAVDRDNKPILTARGIINGEFVKLTADKDGWLLFPNASFQANGQVLINAPGYRPRSVPFSQDRYTVTLEPDPGLHLTVLRKRDAMPIMGATVRRRIPPDVLVWDEPARLEQALNALCSEGLQTNHEGIALVPGVRFQGVHAVLEVSHPEEGTILLPLREVTLDVETNWYAPVEVYLEKLSPLSVLIVDSRNSPLAQTPVQVWRLGLAFDYVTDQGGLLSLDREPTIGVGETYVDVLLAEQCTWRAAKPVLAPGHTRVIAAHYEPIVGWLRATKPSEYVVASAFATAPEDPDSVYGAQPWPWETLEWIPVESDGGFVLKTGWQGTATCVLLRHRQSAMVLDAAIVERGQKVILETPPVCTITLTTAADQGQPDWRIEFAPVESFGHRLSTRKYGGRTSVLIGELPQTLAVPFGYYSIDVVGTRFRRPLQQIKAEAPALEVYLDLPPHHQVSGTVRGQIAGPLVGASVTFLDAQRDLLADVTTEAGGLYSCEFLNHHSLNVVVHWPYSLDQPWLNYEVGTSLYLDQARPELNIVVPESRLVVKREKTGTLASSLSCILTRWSGDQRTGMWPIQLLDSSTEVELTLPPGAYSVAPNAAGSEAAEERINLLPGRREAITVDLRSPALLDFSFSLPPLASCVARVTSYDEHQNIVIDEDRFSFVRRGYKTFLVPPGRLTVEIQVTLQLENGQEVLSELRTVAHCQADRKTPVALSFDAEGNPQIKKAYQPHQEEF